MKYILYILLIFPFVGCGSSYLEGNKVRIEFHDAASRDCELLSVRDNVFVVGEDISDSTLRASLVPIADIRRVWVGSSAEITGMIIGGIVGLVGSVITVVSIYGPDAQGGEGLALGGAIIAIPFAIAGGVIGYLIPSAEVAYDPMNAKDLISIKELARYNRYSEPPELQKLK